MNSRGLTISAWSMQRLAAAGSQGRAVAAPRQPGVLEQPTDRAPCLRAGHQRPARGHERVRPHGHHLDEVISKWLMMTLPL